MAADFVHHSETLPLFITHPKVRRSRCMCLLFLLLIAIFVGLAPIMVYRSLGVPLEDGLRGHRNAQPCIIVQQNPFNESPPPDRAEAQIQWLVQSQSPGMAAKPKIIIPKAHLRPPIPVRPASSFTPLDLPTTTHLHHTPRS